MTDAYAIKGPDGSIDALSVAETEGSCTTSFASEMGKQWRDLQREGYTCVPVTVSEFEEPLSPELAKKYPLDRRLRIFIEQLMLADDVAKEFDYEEAKRLHRELVDRLTAMTDPNKAEENGMSESNAKRLERVKHDWDKEASMHAEDKDWLIALAEERVMIEWHGLAVAPYHNEWLCSLPGHIHKSADNLSTAIRSVVAKIGEGNG